MRKLFFYFLMCLTLLQCKKEENELMVISGKVIDARSGEPASGIEIDFLIQGVVDGTFNNNYRKVTSDVSDNNGNYSLNFDEGTPSSFRFEIEGPGFNFSRQDFNPDNFSSTDENNLDLAIDSRAWLRLRVVNSTPANNGDQITFSLSTENIGCPDCCQSEVFSYAGQVDETLYCEAFGNSEASVEGIVLDVIQGQLSAFESVVLIPQDTTELVLSF
ncbi:MAG: hypothetical protein AAF487_13440 [Bacteroidota bacterium]